ncbi:MAG: CoA transferase [Acidimicrobiales bacterium]
MSLLSPYRVLDLTDERGQLAGLLLAQLGAEVIAVEPPEGQRSRRVAPFAGADDVADDADLERSLVHWAFNRGKRSVVLDLAGSAPDREAFLGLAAGADVLLESGRPGAWAALGLDYEALAARNPALVYVSITPFGQQGPKAGYHDSDLVVLAAGGYLVLTGDEDRPPLRLSLPQAHLHGAADAAGAALVALLERSRSGLGQHVDVSAQASLVSATQSFVLSHPFGAPIIRRVTGGVKMPPFTLRLVWECADGHVSANVFYGPSLGPYTRRLFEWIHAEGECEARWPEKDWVRFALLVAEGKETTEEFDRANEVAAAFFRRRTKAELLDAAMSRRLLIAPVATVADVAHSAQLADRGYWELVTTPAGPTRFPGAVAKLSATPMAPLAAPPRLGEHTAAVLAEPARRPAAPAVRKASARPDGLALEGVKVLDFMWAMAGPATSRVLADQGATVVRVESIRRLDAGRAAQPLVGDQQGLENGGLYLNNNTGKLGLALDLTKPGAHEVVLDLVRWADVVCESFSPRAMRGLGLGYETLAEVNPGVIMLSTCLMGQTGPLALFAGFGNLAAAISGFTNLAGWPDRPPSGPYSAYTDYVAPRVSVAVVLAALDHRRRTGQGQHIDFSQAEASLHLLGPALLDYEVNGRLLERNGNRDGASCPHGVFRCAARGGDDDRWAALSCPDDRAWAALAGELGRADLAGLGLAERQARADELEALVEGWTRSRDEDVVERRLQALGLPAHALANSPELCADPQLARRGHLVTTEHALHGPLVVEGARFLLSRTQPSSYRAAPTLGQDSFEVLHDLLGYDKDRIAELAAAGLLE